MRRNNRLTVLLFLLSVCSATAADTTVFSIQDFWRLVLQHHPVVKQAELLNEAARQELRMARGVFDPSLSYTYANKVYKGSGYYDLQEGTLKIPTWYNLDFKAGIEENTGNAVDPQELTSRSGLGYAGVSVPLGRGLIIDERRTIVKQARLLKYLAEAEQIKEVNKILLQSSKDYWEWYFAWHQLSFLNEGLVLAKVRFNAVVQRIIQGDLAAIDSVEALLEVQRREVQVQEASLLWQNCRLFLSNHLWTENGQPLELEPTAIPGESGTERLALSADSLTYYTNYADSLHPEVRKLDIKIRQMQLERSLRKEYLKPQLQLSYNVLVNGFSYGDAFNSGYAANNYKTGVDFYLPLFLRKERGKLQLTNVKLKQSSYELSNTRRQVNNQVRIAYNEVKNLEQIIDLQQAALLNYRALLKGEQQRFGNGESTIFLVNQRERALIENEIKYRELLAKYAKGVLLWRWSTGITALGIR